MKHFDAGKGDTKREPDPQYCNPKVLKTWDMGSIGCKNGFHTFYEETCKYCERSKEETNGNSNS